MATSIFVRITSMLQEDEINRWCSERFGIRENYGCFDNGKIENWTSYYDNVNGPLSREYEFQREEDAVLFALRWK